MRLHSVLVATVLLAACSDQAPEPAEVRLGVILATTGPASFIGTPERAVLEALLPAEDAAGRNDAGFTLVIHDSGGDSARARTIFEELATDETIVGVIGPSTSGEAIAVGPRADELELPLLSLGASKRTILDGQGQIRPWVFKFAQNDDLAAERLASAMRANGDLDVALLHSNDAFGTGAAEAFRAAAASSIRLALDVVFPAQLTAAESFAAQVDPSTPAVMIWGTSPGPALLVRALRERGYAGRIYLSHGNASEAFLTDAGPAAEEALLVGSRVFLTPDALVAGQPADDAILAYRTLWATVGTGIPSTFGGHASDALRAVLATFGAEQRALSTEDRRRALRDGLERLAGFAGVTGTFTFSANDHAGLGPEAFELYVIREGRFVPFETP